MSSLPPPPAPRRRPTGLLGFAAVLAVVLVWWLFSGNGPSGPSGNDPRLSVPDVDASASPGVVAAGSEVVVVGGLRIDGFVVEQERTLALNYTVPAGECAGDLGTTRVLETSAAVTVTLARPVAEGCDPLEVGAQATTRLRLESPLDGRSVIDGSLSQPVRVTPDPTTYDAAG